MEQSKALQRLMEAADLLKLVEELNTPGAIESLSDSARSGIRVTLRSAREAILSSHDALATQMIQRARMHVGSEALQSELPESQTQAVLQAERITASGAISTAAAAGVPGGARGRRDLRASLEKMIEAKGQ